jgi:hypothetical protein
MPLSPKSARRTTAWYFPSTLGYFCCCALKAAWASASLRCEDAGELHGVTAVIEQRNIRLTCRPREADGVLIHPGLVEIEAKDGRKAGPSQCSRQDWFSFDLLI